MNTRRRTPKTVSVALCAVLLGLGSLAASRARTETLDTSLFVESGPTPRSLEVDRFIQLPPEVVFEQITTPEGVRSWLDIECNIGLAIGGPYELMFNPGRGRGNRGTEGSQILGYAPGRMLCIAWNVPTSLGEVRGLRSWVTFLLEPSQNGTIVRVVHSGFGNSPGWDKAYDHYESGWPTVLGMLKRSLESTAD